MPTGLKIPVGVDKSGGAAVETNESAQTKKLLVLALSEGGDENPFQNIGLPADLIFSIKSPALRARSEKMINRILAKFTERVALGPKEPFTFKEDTPGEYELTFQYVDLLTNKVTDFRKGFRRG